MRDPRSQTLVASLHAWPHGWPGVWQGCVCLPGPILSRTWCPGTHLHYGCLPLGNIADGSSQRVGSVAPRGALALHPRNAGTAPAAAPMVLTKLLVLVALQRPTCSPTSPSGSRPTPRTPLVGAGLAPWGTQGQKRTRTRAGLLSVHLVCAAHRWALPLLLPSSRLLSSHRHTEHHYFAAPTGRLHGVVSPETVDEVARRVATLGTEPESAGPAGAKKKGGKK